MLSAKDRMLLDFCRLGTAGLARRAPGTWGSAVAAVLAPVWYLPLPLSGRALVLAGLFVAGSLAATRAETLLGRKDPSEVVVDELVGMWLALLPFAAPSLGMVLAAFVLFRFFDILKPGPVRAAERWMPAGWGVMLDDVVAGLLASLGVAALRAGGLL